MQYHLKISSSGKVFNNTGKTFCEEKLRRVCKSKQGLARHQNAKHREHKPDQEEVVKKNLSAEDRLHALYFKKYINNCAKQLATDGSYSDETILIHLVLIIVLLMMQKTSEYSTADDDKFINAKNRGGLWKVSPGVFEIFLIVEKHFQGFP